MQNNGLDSSTKHLDMDCDICSSVGYLGRLELESVVGKEDHKLTFLSCKFDAPT